MDKKYNIFYSWQSDLPKHTNLNAIRTALRDASNKVEDELEDIHLNLDEATRGKSGSPNIPMTILDKISKCDIFICDLTTINKDASSEFRKTPNPNVLIELGYAIAKIGWYRIIMLFNEHHGKFPDDLPFDIDRHRATRFKIIDKKDNNGKGNLSKTLQIAIKSIIEESPLKPTDLVKETPAEVKKRSDINNLKQILSSINIPIFEHFIEELPNLIYHKIFHFKEDVFTKMESTTFHIYDEELMNLLKIFKEKWKKTLSYSQYYYSHGSTDYYKFYIPADVFPSPEAEKSFYEILKIKNELLNDFKELYKFVRENYLEVNIEEMNKIALENYNETDEALENLLKR